MVGSLFSWKSLLTNRRTRDDFQLVSNLVFTEKKVPIDFSEVRGGWCRLTFPTAASPSSTSLTLLLGFAVVADAAFDMVQSGEESFKYPDTRREMPD